MAIGADPDPKLGMTPDRAREKAQRNEAAKTAMRIVRKFPQIEQNVIVPALAVEIGRAILAAVQPLEEEIERLKSEQSPALRASVHRRATESRRAESAEEDLRDARFEILAHKGALDSAEARCKALEGALEEIVINFGSTKELKKIARAALSPASAQPKTEETKCQA